jgi:hypothetical protein
MSNCVDVYLAVYSLKSRPFCLSVFRIRIRIIGPDPVPDPLKETLIWIRVPKKIVINSLTNQLKILKIYFFLKKSLILFNIRE